MNNTEVVWVCALTACFCHTVTQKSQNPSVDGDMAAALFQKKKKKRVSNGVKKKRTTGQNLHDATVRDGPGRGLRGEGTNETQALKQQRQRGEPRMEKMTSINRIRLP